MSDGSTITVNFSRAMPLFPLDSAVLLPQQVLPLHIFEPRYRQMIQHVLDGAGQIAMAVFEGDRWKQEYHGRPPLRPCVCVGQVVQHERQDDGRYNLLLQGVCRARVTGELPATTEKLYREAILMPLPADEPVEAELEEHRLRLEELLGDGPLTRLAAAPTICEYLRNVKIPTSAILELVSFTLLQDAELRYRLLAEPKVRRRAQLIERELSDLGGLLRRAARQRPQDWPKGCAWN